MDYQSLVKENEELKLKIIYLEKENEELSQSLKNLKDPAYCRMYGLYYNGD